MRKGSLRLPFLVDLMPEGFRTLRVPSRRYFVLALSAAVGAP